jgi:gliding motility-associated-like protein
VISGLPKDGILNSLLYEKLIPQKCLNLPNAKELIIFLFNLKKMKTTLLVVLLSMLFLTSLPAQIDKVLVLDGCTNYFEVPDNDLMDYNDVLSLECWIRPNCEDGNRIVLSKQYCQGEYGYYLSVNEGRLLWSYSQTGFCSSPNNYQTEEIEILPDVFTHIAVVHNQQEIKLFVNGVEVAQGQFVGNFSSIHNSAEPFRIGAYRNINGEISNFFSGLVDEVRMWNFELTAQLIQDRMNTILSGGELGLILYFNMESIGVGSDLTLFNQSDYDSIFDAYPIGFTESMPRTIFPGAYDLNLVDLGDDVSTCDESWMLSTGIEDYKQLEWSTGDMSETLLVTESGNYAVTVETELCKFYTDEITVTLGEAVLQAFDFEICEGESLIIGTNTFTEAGIYYDTLSMAIGCDSINQYNVTMLPVQSSSVEIATCPESPVIYAGQELAPGSTTIFELTGGNGCDSIVTVQVTPTLVFQETLVYEVCDGETIEYDGTLLMPGTSADFVLTSVEGCDSIVTVNVELLETENDFLGPDQIVCNESVILNSPYENTTWDNGVVGSTFEVVAAGFYSAYFLDGQGCIVADTIHIEFADQAFYVPNAFSPNEDGQNDCFEIYAPLGQQWQNFKWSIYNRWGGLVFQTSDINDCWDGTINNRRAMEGVYVWVIRGTIAGCSEDGEWKGNVVLVR